MQICNYLLSYHVLVMQVYSVFTKKVPLHHVMVIPWYLDMHHCIRSSTLDYCVMHWYEYGNKRTCLIVILSYYMILGW